MTNNVAVLVACDGVKLKLTCTPELLAKPFEECVVGPFLGAFNKKRSTSYTPQSLANAVRVPSIHIHIVACAPFGRRVRALELHRG